MNPDLGNKKIVILTGALGLAALIFVFGTSRQPVDFNSEIKPIFNKKCITCHGGVRRQADFSLLFRSEALARNKSGKPAIIPGDPDHSEMIRRVGSNDPEERMPYKHEALSKAEIGLLRQWIREGAHWGDHWAYVAVEPVIVPKPTAHFFGLIPAAHLDWAKNDIDYFIYDRLKAEKLKPSAEADKPVLLRRVSLDLTGLPPAPELARQYLQKPDDAAYERLVDSLLASPRFGERWASVWLDLARYADTKGYEADGQRNIWKYRDWLIRSFNADKPYNVFLTEQIAGDLLPDPTDDQLIATAFHRNTMTNDEGGTDNEEFRTAAVLDRVNTTWQGLMGTTFACVQCHSHPYDPFKHDEYYQFMAFFNDARDEDTYADYPVLRAFDSADSRKLVNLTAWLQKNSTIENAKEELRFLKTWQYSINSIQADQLVNSALADTKFLVFRNHAVARLPHVNLDGKERLVYRYQSYRRGGDWTIRLDSITGAVVQTIHPAKTKTDWEISYTDFPPVKGTHDLIMTYNNPGLKNPAKDGMTFEWFHFGQRLPVKNTKEDLEMEKSYWSLLAKTVSGTPVMMENPASMHRNTYVFERGNWLVRGRLVQPDVPHSLNPFPSRAPRNRLGLAMWMTDKKNPLTARTLVNRLWEQVFGAGLVETLEDMGTQGAAPTHKELLDDLAYQFMNADAWSIKKLLKEIVMSATYRQDSRISPALLKKDPYNKLYARGPRVRLSAEQIRDQALVFSELLSEKMFGPPVMPWEPPGIWHSPYNNNDWKKSDGEDQYRRSVYTFWKRTAPYPSMITFDGASREVCASRRILTNTPLQALVTLNDSVYLEASRHLAYRMMDMAKNKNDVAAVIGSGYGITTLKTASPEKLKILENLYDTAYRRYKSDPETGCEMIGVNDRHNNPETAAMVVVAGALLNLDEVITKN
jgi:mono/diheme cytochrome c family protein